MSDIRGRYHVDLTTEKVRNAFMLLELGQVPESKFRQPKPKNPDDKIYMYFYDEETRRHVGRWVRAGDYFPDSYFESNRSKDDDGER